MRGRKRLPPDKPAYIDEIIAETPSSQSSSPPSKRVKRQDVADRIAKNKIVGFFVMKKTLKSFYKPEAKELAWDEYIQEVNHAVVEAYRLANCYGGCGRSVDRDVNAVNILSVLQNQLAGMTERPLRLWR